ncbi:replication protein A [Thermogymnomonas acidicola]|uniref:Replication protein A n=2 Tax=Thermogymnomonas acidicola TaxID=399579 RepID=A0AA37BQ56_9ARCH|nr:replication protein A [Thermogymnomonas acidicola]
MIPDMSQVKIGDIKAATENVDVRVKVLSLNQRELHNQRGDSIYFSGIVGDDTGTISFTAWTFPSAIRPGDVIDINNAYVKEFNGKLRLYVDSRSEVILRPKDEIEVRRSYREFKVKDLNTRDAYVSVKGRVSGIRVTEQERDGQKVTIYSGYLEDETGRVRLTSFDVPLVEGGVYQFEGARVSEYNGILRVTVQNRTRVSQVTEEISMGKRYYSISELNDSIGGITLTGFAVTVGEKSGIIYRCSVCNRVIEEVRCPDHPIDVPKMDIFAYFTLDDGTGTVQCTCGRQVLMPLLGLTDADLDFTKSRLDTRTISGRIEAALLGRAISVEGDLTKGTNGLTLRARSISYISKDDLKEISIMIQEEIS